MSTPAAMPASQGSLFLAAVSAGVRRLAGAISTRRVSASSVSGAVVGAPVDSPNRFATSAAFRGRAAGFFARHARIVSSHRSGIGGPKAPVSARCASIGPGVPCKIWVATSPR